jgi:dolichyl-phosphate-mannose-protein mannosyltransferase
MSVSDGLRAPAPGASTRGPRARNLQGTPGSTGAFATAARRTGVSRWTADGWGAIGVTATFIALTCWWLTQDRGIPIYDAGSHLQTVFDFHDMIQAGNLLGPFHYNSPYPPLGMLVGTLAAFIGGVNVAAPIIGENLVFASLLAFGCYQTSRLLFGSRAGLLSVAFVLGSALVISQLHVYMLDVPEAAVVAVSIWLLLMCEDFSRPGFSALAGLAVGAGLLVKVQYPSFVAGIVLIALLRGGWRNWRGLVAFALVALAVAGPWYLDHLSQFSTFARNAGSNPATLPTNAPPTLSWANFSWYFWNILNSQLMAFLFALLLGGTTWMFLYFFRHRRGVLRSLTGGTGISRGEDDAAPTVVADHRGSSAADRGLATATGGESPAADRGSAVMAAGGRVLDLRLELFAGALFAWLFITLTPDHDIRYGIPLLPYLAVIGTGWIVALPHRLHALAIGVLLVGAIANTLSTTIGVDGEAQVTVGPTQSVNLNESLPNRIRLYSSEKFLAAGPERDGDVPGLLQALHRGGVRNLTWAYDQSSGANFSFEGLFPLARIAKLTASLTGSPTFSNSPEVATLIHEPVGASSPPTCTRVSDGTGVWVVRYDAAARKDALYCPSRRPQFYDIGVVG